MIASIMGNMAGGKIVEEWHNKQLTTSEDMDLAIRQTIELIGEGMIPCLCCNLETTGRGVYLPLDHTEDLGNGPHFEDMSRIYSFALCNACMTLAGECDRANVRKRLKEVIGEVMKDSPETIQ